MIILTKHTLTAPAQYTFPFENNQSTDSQSVKWDILQNDCFLLFLFDVHFYTKIFVKIYGEFRKWQILQIILH